MLIIDREVFEKPKLFAGRAATSHEEFGLTHFPDSPEVGSTLRALMEPLIGEYAHVVSPDDWICHDDILGKELEPVDYLVSVENAFDIHIPDADAERLFTIRDLAGYVVAQSRGSSNSTA